MSDLAESYLQVASPSPDANGSQALGRAVRPPAGAGGHIRGNASRNFGAGQTVARTVLAVLLAVLLFVLSASGASAHAELFEATPAVDSTVGGDFHQIAMQFGGLEQDAPHEVAIIGPEGALPIDRVLQDRQRIIVPIEEDWVPGEYTVNYRIFGLDGDISTGTYSFTYQTGAPEPTGISLKQAGDGLNWDTTTVLLTILAALVLLAVVANAIYVWSQVLKQRGRREAEPGEQGEDGDRDEMEIGSYHPDELDADVADLNGAHAD